MEGAIRCSLGSQAQHTHTLEDHTWSIQQSTTTHPLGFAFLTSMFKTGLNKNIIPHTRKLTNIVPIPKPNTDKGTSYRPISLLSVIAKTTGEEPYSLHNSKHIKHAHANTGTKHNILQ